ncbi:MAG: LD-carboxypeptidase [Bacteroidetes bacterium]|nr:LD-carboxypeptidase [Bacteroidota bacterium]
MTPLRIFPPSLQPPGPVRIVAPSSAPRQDADLQRGLAGLREHGLEPQWSEPLLAPVGYLAGNDEHRLRQLNEALAAEGPSTVFCVRGGYGMLRILDLVDFDAVRSRPKLVVGYSDITALQLALFKHTGLVSVSGPMVAAEWKDPSGPNPSHFLDLVSPAFEPGPLDPAHPQQTLVAGRAEGLLLGGNLSLLTRLIGTRHLPDLRGAILFLEDIGESPYRVDGMLAQLQLAGILDGLAGIVMGGFTGGEVEPGKSSLTLTEVFEDYVSDLGIPVATGLRYGHFSDKAAVPIGVMARLEADTSGQAELILLEAPTAG